MSPAALAHPVEPESIEETGLPESTLEQLILKILYFRGDIYGQDLSHAIGLRFSVIQDVGGSAEAASPDPGQAIAGDGQCRARCSL